MTPILGKGPMVYCMVPITTTYLQPTDQQPGVPPVTVSVHSQVGVIILQARVTPPHVDHHRHQPVPEVKAEWTVLDLGSVGPVGRTLADWGV